MSEYNTEQFAERLKDQFDEMVVFKDLKRICTAYLKLLFPNVQRPGDITKQQFKTYCLAPAMEMRSIIKIQLGLLDPDEFGGKSIPAFGVKDVEQ